MVDRNILTMFLGLAVLISFIPFADSLWCRNGIETSVAYIYWEKKCSPKETACFNSAKCTKIGDEDYKDYEWRCISGRSCSNVTGEWIGYYQNIKGRVVETAQQLFRGFSLNGRKQSEANRN